ncbi:MAG TPA: serine hydrolase domain-containing protein [Allosphingosinicella sp.]|nr:serine hydrolase domain-containing protein [Allosphingosinicella sp.]
MRRFVIYAVAGLALVIAIWAGAVYLSTPLPLTPAQRFEIPVAGAAPHRPGAVDYARLDTRLRLLMADPRMVGMAIAVVEGGEIRFIKGYGVTAAGGSEPVTPDTVFRWASLSKGVAADLVARLADQGRLSLFEPVNRHAASLRLPGGNENVATVADLLSHQLGLFGHAQDSKLEDGIAPHYLRGTLATLHNICAPGTCHAYQNVAYDAASEIVERVTGQPYGQAVREQFFAPLGMTGASTSRAGLMRSPSWARPHVGARPVRPEDVNDIYYRIPASGGVNGSIKDLAIWMLAQMGLAPDVLPEHVLAAVQAPRARTPGENFRRRRFRERTSASAYGLGWRILDYAGHRVIGHHGGVRGYRSTILFDPALRSGVVLLWNSSSPRPNALEYEVMDMVYRLPPRDWLELDKPPEPAAPLPETNGLTENEGN